MDFWFIRINFNFNAQGGKEMKTYKERAEELKSAFYYENVNNLNVEKEAKDLIKEIKEKGCGRGTSNVNYDLFCEGDWRCSECQEAIKILEDILK